MWERAGFRIRDSGVRMKSICFPPTAFCLLPTAYCLLHLRAEFELAGLLACAAVFDKMSPRTVEGRTRDFKK